MEEEKNVFANIDYKNKAIPREAPSKISDIDLQHSIYDNIIINSERGTLDTSTIDSFSSISRSRDQVYSLLDLMGEDPIISSAIDIYTSDVCEPNEHKEIIWADSDDANCLGAVTQILESFEVNKNASPWVHSLIKYGDLYLKMYRDSEFDFNKLLKNGGKEEKDKLNEDVVLKVYSKNDRYAEYMDQIKNPAEVFDLVKFGKSYGYLRTHITSNQPQETISGLATSTLNKYTYQFKQNDVDIYGATEFVHACLEDNSSRTDEEVSLTTDSDDEVTFEVRRGQSILYNSFKIWRELSLLEQSVLLNRITKSSVVRTVNVEIGDMEKTEVRTLMQRIKALFEQKSAINTGTSLQSYTNPGPMENTLYFPVHDGKGQVTTSQVGGDVKVGDLTDLDYWKKKLFASLGIPGQFLGDTDDNAGFNGGTSLSIISSRYAKTVKRIQNCFIQAMTDAVNLVLYDRGLNQYIGKFTLKMQEPTTQEEKDRKENLASSINNIREIMNLMDVIEEPKVKLEILKSLLSDVINDSAITEAIEGEIQRLEEGEPMLGDLGGSDELDLGGEDFGGGFEEPLEGGEETASTELELPDEGAGEEPPEEAFYTNRGGELLAEDNLKSFAELGVDYRSVR